MQFPLIFLPPNKKEIFKFSYSNQIKLMMTTIKSTMAVIKTQTLGQIHHQNFAKPRNPLTLAKQSLNLLEHSSCPGNANPWIPTGVAENESGEQISSRTRNIWFSTTGLTREISDLGSPAQRIELGLRSGESFRHLKSDHGSGCWWRAEAEEDSAKAFRLAKAANRFASARFRCSSVISIFGDLGFSECVCVWFQKGLNCAGNSSNWTKCI